MDRYDQPRKWDELDERALVTYNKITFTEDYDRYLLLNIGFEHQDDDVLQDLSGKGNDGLVIGDYRIDFESETKKPLQEGEINIATLKSVDEGKPF